MIKAGKKLLGMLLVACFVAACAAPGPRSTVGGLGGAAAGGLLGSTLGGGATGTAAGVILGGLLGGVVGDRLDAADRRQAQQTAYRAFENEPVGSGTTWRNPDNGNHGTITPTRTYRTAEGTYCREFEQTINVGGDREQAYGTACRQPDGRWQIVE